MMTITFWQVLQAGFWGLSGIAPLFLFGQFVSLVRREKCVPEDAFACLFLAFLTQAFFGVALYIAGTVDGR